MIESVTIWNFQAHRKRRIIFDPRVTSLVGPSDAGKSAILRALRWVFLNKPSGDAFKRFGSAKVKVIVKIDGHTITRVRGKANTYYLDGRKLKAFGNSVPEPIAKILNVTEENFQRQIDAPFWFLKSAGEVSRELNKIVDLQIIDHSLASVAKGLSKAKATATVIEDRLEQALNQRAELSWVPEMLERFSVLSKQINAIKAKRFRTAMLGALCQEALGLKRRAKSLRTAAVASQRVLKLGRLAVDLAEDNRRLGQLLETIQQQRGRLCATKKKLAKLDTRLRAIKTCPLCGSTM